MVESLLWRLTHSCNSTPLIFVACVANPGSETGCRATPCESISSKHNNPSNHWGSGWFFPHPNYP
ncbi:MAG: CRISPR-associated DxTHG motif protein [Rhodothermaceae bacterium TMED105]|nr:MAG: CRISPR-associated DxTHG motif protein [Rhodothermaceae bacterium TMED105]